MIKTLIQHVIIHIILKPLCHVPTHTHTFTLHTHTHIHTTHPHTSHTTHTVFSSQASLLSLHDRFYHDVSSVIPCFRLTNATHQIGCSGWSLGGRKGRERGWREGRWREGKRKRVRKGEGEGEREKQIEGEVHVGGRR